MFAINPTCLLGNFTDVSGKYRVDDLVQVCFEMLNDSQLVVSWDPWDFSSMISVDCRHQSGQKPSSNGIDIIAAWISSGCTASSYLESIHDRRYVVSDVCTVCRGRCFLGDASNTQYEVLCRPHWVDIFCEERMIAKLCHN
jgi:hypothetical protein